MADILILSTADWDHPLWTNKQHLAVSLAAMGHRVVYVESLGIRVLRVKGGQDFLRIARRLLSLFCPLRLRQERIWVLSPPVIPGFVSGKGLWINQWILRVCLLIVSWRLRFRRVRVRTRRQARSPWSTARRSAPRGRPRSPGSARAPGRGAALAGVWSARRGGKSLDPAELP